MHVGTVRGIPVSGRLGTSELVQIIGRFEKSGVKLQCLIGEGNLRWFELSVISEN